MGKIESYLKMFKIQSAEISKNELKRRYRILLKKYHPDLQGGSVPKTQLINEAYRYLLDLAIQHEERIEKIRKRKFKVLNKKFYFYADGSVIDRRKNRVVKFKGRKINSNV
jgi:hypothetical protein